MASQLAVNVTDLTKTYDDRDVLAGVSLSIERGSRTVVLGHNGAGKSTLLEIIATLRTPTTGAVSIEGFDVVTQARDARRLIGLTAQSNALDPLATPAEALGFQGAALGMSRSDTVRRQNELLELFDLDEHRKTRIAKLSGGTRAPFRPDPQSASVVRLALSDAPDVMKTALETISEFGGAVEELRLSEPSLDDVFVALAAR
ncbi:ATP-binding cassette domain-containing protein [Dactylosporangium sp. NPDC051484]|uniref:ATP-binding cassette domain-containing protein n=1 Tax=Dactylosporangium sp. NPDC051484 TaxID=3154942 RepID=UPI003450FC36